MIKWIPITFQNFINLETSFIDWLHDYVIIFLIFVVIFVGGILYLIKKNRYFRTNINEFSILETVWTILPRFILILIGIPSLFVLYSRERVLSPNLTLKTTGHQWYWSYDFCDFNNVEFDRFLKPLEEIERGEFRLLETDNHVVLPLNISFRTVVSSSDVLHRWTVPTLGIKADANPGRINLLYITNLQTPGIFFGQCSEICGANHRFIPIRLEIVPVRIFTSWLERFYNWS